MEIAGSSVLKISDDMTPKEPEIADFCACHCRDVQESSFFRSQRLLITLEAELRIGIWSAMWFGFIRFCVDGARPLPVAWN